MTNVKILWIALRITLEFACWPILFFVLSTAFLTVGIVQAAAGFLWTDLAGITCFVVEMVLLVRCMLAIGDGSLKSYAEKRLKEMGY